MVFALQNKYDNIQKREALRTFRKYMENREYIKERNHKGNNK